MCSPEVWQDVRARIELANLVPADHISWPNERFVTPDPNGESPLWIIVEAAANLAEPIELGGGVWQETGSVWIHAVAPSGAGVTGLRQLTKLAANAFRGLPPGPVTYTGADIGMGEAGDEDGNWYIVSVRIEYRYQDR